MRAHGTALCAWLACCAAAAALSAHKYSTRVVRTKYGPLRGIVVHAHPQVEAYLGVPYATPPLGSLRYMPPVTPSMWRAPRLADAPGAACPQAPPPAASMPRADALLQYPRARLRQLDRLLPLLANQSEDCLYVNLYVPVTVTELDTGAHPKMSQTFGSKRSAKHTSSQFLNVRVPQGLEIVVERTEVTYSNPTYIEFVNVSTRRASRRGGFVSSLHATTLHTWGNNVTVELVMYEFLSNEYKRSFVQVHGKVCDLLENMPFLGPILQQTELVNKTCPYAPGTYHLVNVTLSSSLLKSRFPFQKGRVDMEISLTEDARTRIAAGHTYFHLRGYTKPAG